MPSPLSDTTDRPFTGGLLNPAAPTPEGVVGPEGKGARTRYNVYRNNVTVSLINAMADIFPATQRIVGEEFFRALAREYVRVHPPTSPLLFLYGEHFPDFLSSFEHVRHLPYLADVARLERAWLTAYHAADVEPLDPGQLANFPPDQIGALTFTAKPGTAIIASSYPVFTIYAMNRDLMTVGPVDLAMAENVLVTRPDADVVVTPTSAPETAFFMSLMDDSQTLETAAANAMALDPAFNLNDALAKLFGTGASSTAVLADPAPLSPTDATETGSTP
ncbi:MAG: DNA-binding domain-containing protein [Pseudomonadota bacterium]